MYQTWGYYRQSITITLGQSITITISGQFQYITTTITIVLSN